MARRRNAARREKTRRSEQCINDSGHWVHDRARTIAALPRVAAGRLVRFVGRMFAQRTQRLPRQLIESHSPRVQLLHEFPAHLGAPETPDVIGDAGDRVLPRLGTKEIADIVRHMYQMLCAAHGLSVPNMRLGAGPTPAPAVRSLG